MERCEGMQQSVRGGQKKILIMLWGCRTNVRQLILYSTQQKYLLMRQPHFVCAKRNAGIKISDEILKDFL